MKNCFLIEFKYPEIMLCILIWFPFIIACIPSDNLIN